MLDLNQAGSVASLIAFAVLVFGGISRFYKRYRAAMAKEKSDALEFADWLSSLVDESSTATARSDAAAFTQHVIGRQRHFVITIYLRLLISLLIGVGGFLVFNALSLKILAWQFLGYGVLTTCVFLWVQLSVTRLLRHAEYEVGAAWAKQIDKARKKRQRTANQAL